MIKVQIAMMGRSYDAAEQLPSELELAAEARVSDALAAIARSLPAERQLPASCLVVHNGTHLGTVATHDNPSLTDRDDLLLIAPVAGG